MDRTAYRMLYDSIHDFKATAALVESKIMRCGVGSKSLEVAPDMSGRPLDRGPGHAWVSTN